MIVPLFKGCISVSTNSTSGGWAEEISWSWVATSTAVPSGLGSGGWTWDISKSMPGSEINSDSTSPACSGRGDWSVKISLFSLQISVLIPGCSTTFRSDASWNDWVQFSVLIPGCFTRVSGSMSRVPSGAAEMNSGTRRQRIMRNPRLIFIVTTKINWGGNTEMKKIKWYLIL